MAAQTSSNPMKLPLLGAIEVKCKSLLRPTAQHQELNFSHLPLDVSLGHLKKKEVGNSKMKVNLLQAEDYLYRR